MVEERKADRFGDKGGQEETVNCEAKCFAAQQHQG
jgi:hypothetical protein